MALIKLVTIFVPMEPMAIHNRNPVSLSVLSPHQKLTTPFTAPLLTEIFVEKYVLAPNMPLQEPDSA